MPVVYAKRITADDLTQEVQVEFVGERHCPLSATDLSFIVGERQFGRGRFSGVFKAELIKPDRMAIAIKVAQFSCLHSSSVHLDDACINRSAHHSCGRSATACRDRHSGQIALPIHRLCLLLLHQTGCI